MIRKILLGLVFLLALIASGAFAQVLTEPGLDIVLLPVINDTEIEVWENKYYPVNVFDQKLTEEFTSLLREYPYSRVKTLTPFEEEVWLKGGSPRADLGIKLHLYKLKMTDRQHLGTDRMGYVALRMEIYGGDTRELIYATSVAGEDRRFTLSPGDGRIFYLTHQPESGNFIFLRPLDFLPVNKLFPRGLDFWQLFPNVGDDDQPLSRPLWSSFKRTSYWNAFKKALRKSRDSLFEGVSGYHMVGRLISPTKDSLSSNPPRRRRYIMSLGMVEGAKKGDLLNILRSDRYDTVDPERPIVVLPDNGGLVKVIAVQDHEAVVEVVKESAEAPIKLRDLVVLPLYNPKRK